MQTRLKHWLYHCIIVISVLWVNFFSFVHAYSLAGHALIVELSLQYMLSPIDPLEKIAITTSKMVIEEIKLSRKSDYLKSVSPIAFLSTLPDNYKIRSRSLIELFDQYQLPFPKKYRQNPLFSIPTSQWHYSHYFFLGTKQCSIKIKESNGRLYAILPILMDWFDNATNSSVRGVLLMFIVHLIGDMGQPFHRVSSSMLDCRSDLGGNRIGISCQKFQKAPFQLKCLKNQHRYWDSVGGILLRKPIQQLMIDMQYETIRYPRYFFMTFNHGVVAFL